MTILVGLLCEDGVVIGSDSSATFVRSDRQPTIEQPIQKVQIVEGRAILASPGEIGLGQRFHAVVEQYWRDGKNKKKDRIQIGKELCTAGLTDFRSTFLGSVNLGAILAFSSGYDFHLCEFEPGSFQPEFKNEDLWYVSMGSGQQLCDPFLGLMRKVFWETSRPRLVEGVFVVTWALQHAIDLNPGGIKGPLQIATLSKPEGGKDIKVELLDGAALSEHQDNVKAAEKYLGEYAKTFRTENIEEAPSLPKAPGRK